MAPLPALARGFDTAKVNQRLSEKRVDTNRPSHSVAEIRYHGVPTMKPFLSILAIFLTAQPIFARAADDRAKVAFFEQHVRPVLSEHCVKCHGARKQESDLRLDSRAAMLTGGESGAAMVPFKPDDSLILEAIGYESFEMPPSGKLNKKPIAAIRKWIADGAVWPSDSPIREPGRVITDDDRNWWAFRPLAQPKVPQVARGGWKKQAIDQFVFAQLAAKEMRPAPLAEKATLVRRAYFDVIGLPPTPRQVADFVTDQSPDAWERLIDRLLASPHYGEHWARHWLDVVRYSESDGWNQDAYRPNIWRYRDYVVNAFNTDKPWPQFVRQQLAGDELPGDDPENIVATGFLRLGIYEYNQRDAKGQWNDIMNETTDVVADTFFGVSMACARCHDHKFDPLLQRDYFALRAFFEPIEWRDDRLYATDRQRDAYNQQLAEWKTKAGGVLSKIDALLKPYHDRKWKSTVDKFPLDIQACFDKPVTVRNSWEHQMAYLVARQFEDEAGGPLKSMKKADKAAYERLKKELSQFDDIKPKPLPQLMAASDFAGTASSTIIPDTNNAVRPDFLTVLSNRIVESDALRQLALAEGTAPDPVVHAVRAKKKRTDGFMPSQPRPESLRYGGRRTALARWITSSENPLTNRVIVNRVWQYHFGSGLVSTPNDFGEQGQLPTHPQLLDWLTVRFIEDGHSFKRLHKRILMSSTWRQSATHHEAHAYSQLDPTESLLWRARVRRLDAEQIRDAMLIASGELNTKPGGPSGDLKSPRRSLYIKSLRNRPDPFLHQFDMANGLKSVAVRNSTVTPTQALLLINGDYALARARAFAKKLLAEKPSTVEKLIDNIFSTTTGRMATIAEKSRAARFLNIELDHQPMDLDLDRLTDLCHVTFNSNEFLYVD